MKRTNKGNSIVLCSDWIAFAEGLQLTLSATLFDIVLGAVFYLCADRHRPPHMHRLSLPSPGPSVPRCSGMQPDHWRRSRPRIQPACAPVKLSVKVVIQLFLSLAFKVAAHRPRRGRRCRRPRSALFSTPFPASTSAQSCLDFL
jgi:hypothetical protein